MTPPIIMHVNYCEQGQTIDEMCRKAVRWGYDGIEFRRKRTGQNETPDGYLAAVARAVDASGLSYALFGGPGANLMAPDIDTRSRELDELLAFYRLAATRFDLTVCNTMSGPLLNPAKGVPYGQYENQGSAIARDEHWEWAAAGFRQLGAMAEELGFRLAFETHMGYLHDLPEPSRRLVDLIGSTAVGINLDYGNATYFPGPPSLSDAVAQCGDRLYYVHLKNSVGVRGLGGRLPTALAEGEINNREFLRLIMEAAYDGPLCVEAPRAGDREWFAQQDLAYIKALLDDLGW